MSTAIFRNLRSRARSAAAAVAAIVVSLAAAAPATAQSVYTYTGNPFTLFSCGASSGGGVLNCATPAPTNLLTTYQATDRVTATLSFTQPLPTNLALADVSILPGFQLSMNDGRHTVTYAMAVGKITLVSTDSGGNITAWRLILNTGGADNGGISTQNAAFVADNGTLRCCDPATADFANRIGLAGTWVAPPASPSAAVTALITLINTTELGLTVGQAASLTDKLNNALTSIAAGLNKQAINQLNAFISSVDTAQKTGKMLPDTAATLTAAARAVIAMLT